MKTPLRVRVTLIALCACIPVTALLCGVQLTRGFRAALSGEITRCQSAYSTLRAAIGVTLTAFGEDDPGRAARIALRYMDEPLVLVTGAGGALWHDTFTPETEALLAGMPSASEERYTVAALGDKRYFLAHGAPVGDLHVYVARDITHVYRRAREDAAFSALVLLCAGALLALVCYPMIRACLAPIARLEAAAGRIAGGDYAARAKPGKREDEVRRLSEAFNQMADAVQKRDESQRLFIANMAHELKTPLTAMIGYADLLLRARLSDEQQKTALEAIREQGARAERMNQKLLTLSGLAGGAPVEMKECQTTTLFAAAVRAVESARESKCVRIITNAARKTLVCDEALMVSLIANLLGNAIKASAAGGDIELTYIGNTLSVRDHGEGIAPEHLPRVFEPFYMADASRSRAQNGAGLGLTLVQKIAEAHGARVEIDSQQGSGTRVSVIFTGL